MKRYMLVFDASVTKEARAEVIMRLDKMQCMYSIGTNNTRHDARLGKVPMVDFISIIWDSSVDFLSSDFYSKLPDGCRVQ